MCVEGCEGGGFKVHLSFPFVEFRMKSERLSDGREGVRVRGERQRMARGHTEAGKPNPKILRGSDSFSSSFVFLALENKCLSGDRRCIYFP